MNKAHDEEDCQKEKRRARHLAADIGKAEEQPFAAKRKRQQQREVEDHPIDRVVRSRFDIWVAPPFKTPRLARGPLELAVAPRLQVLFGLQQSQARLLVQAHELVVAHPVARQLLDPHVVENPHVARGRVPRAQHHALIYEIAAPERLLYRRLIHIGRAHRLGHPFGGRAAQQVAHAEEARAH